MKCPRCIAAQYDEAELLRDHVMPEIDAASLEHALIHTLECIDFLRQEIPLLR